MCKNLTATIILLLAMATGNAQPLFTYGPHKVSKETFLRAYEKNNLGGKDAAAMQQYLELYTRFRLKVQDAYDMKLDTLPSQKADLENFRNQVIGMYLTDDSMMLELVKVSMANSKRDIRLSHIYIPFNGTDTLAASDAIKNAAKAVQQGKSFENVAMEFSKDPSVKSNKGDIGWISSFTLPYAIESLVYNTPIGTISSIYKSSTAYHLFRPSAERPATGNIHVAQILLELPENAPSREADRVKKLADSLYTVIVAGGDFGKLALGFSSDNASFNNQGVLQPFSPGTHDPLFEEQAVMLSDKNIFSKPFRTANGWHILRFLRRYPRPTDINNAEDIAAMKTLIQNDDRNALIRLSVLQRARKATGIPAETSEDEVLEKYIAGLEQYDSGYAAQINEFAEGNLLFEAMQRKVWDKSAGDEKGLQQYYKNNSGRYKWKESVSGVLFSSTDASVLRSFHKKLMAEPETWKGLILLENGAVQYDSSRFEIDQLPLKLPETKSGLITEPVYNKADELHQFFYLIKTWPANVSRSYEEAKGFVLNDYQQVLEDAWIKELKKKYPVKINQTVWKSINR
ncbi:peptidylprolyl isomerase [Flavihumibacter sp.]|uniref:peptidylprolyl isomerase n=1 Tax=Flavihumibacter sp. TaxID=1913981 RepID=UPI002FC78CDB|nr:peptidylprolyl isomerase [Flavihumibacter sediminis]